MSTFDKMTPQSRQELAEQLKALQQLVESRFQRGGNLHWQVGDTLNAIRQRLLSESPETDRPYLEATIPAIAVDRPTTGGQYTVSSDEGVRLFRQLLALVAGSPQAEPAPPDKSAPHQNEGPPRIFIGHGRSRLWARVQVFLEHDLGLRTINYEAESRIGESIAPILEQFLDQAAFAVLLLTAEDETTQGMKRARQNVVHEIGLFQGKLGFRKVVLLQQDGIEEFSNVAGLQYLPFEGDKIESAFYELRRVLQREGIVA